MRSITWNEAVKINEADTDYHRCDLWKAIQRGDFPEWELGLQLFDEKFSEKFPFNLLDSTKLIHGENLPIKIIGRLVLNRYVDIFLQRQNKWLLHSEYCARNRFQE